MLGYATARDARLAGLAPASRDRASLSVGAKVDDQIPPPPVLFQRHGVKMVEVRTNTPPVTADVLDFVPFRDRTHPQGVSVSVGVRLAPFPITLDGEEPIAVRFDTTDPIPTGVGLLDHVLEAFVLGAAKRAVQCWARHKPILSGQVI